MKYSTKRNAVRWLHIIVGSIIATYIYSPWGQIPAFQIATKAVIIPLTILSGMWLWKGHLLKNFSYKPKTVNIVTLIIVCSTALELVSFIYPNSNNNKLVLQLSNVKKLGKIYVSFCTKSSEWSANGKYHFQYENPQEGINTYIITSIPQGTYAVAIFQDLNGNGKLDENMFGAPKEPFAFSNNIVPRFSTPTFEDCKFNFSGTEQTISIKLIN